MLKRRAEIQNDLRRSRDSPLLAERELYLIRNRLAQFPAAVQAITLTANELRRPIDTLKVCDVEMPCWSTSPSAAPVARAMDLVKPEISAGSRQRPRHSLWRRWEHRQIVATIRDRPDSSRIDSVPEQRR